MNHGIYLRVNIDKFVDVGNYHWTIDDDGNEVFDPIPGRMTRRLGLTGLFVGILWCASAILVPNRLFQILLCTVGGLFPVFSFLLGTILDRFGKIRGPLLILRRDQTIVLPRKDVEIVPDEETYVELVPDSEKLSDMRITLMICRGEERWPVTGGGFLPWSKPSPLERLCAKLHERYPTPLRFRNEERENELDRHKIYARNFLRVILLILGIGFTTMGSFALCALPGEKDRMSFDIVFPAAMIVFGTVLLVSFIVMSFGKRNRR